MKRKIDWALTHMNIMLPIMFGIVYIGAIFYSANQMGNYTSLSEVMFWAFILLLIVEKLAGIIKIENPIKYLDLEVLKKKEVKA